MLTMDSVVNVNLTIGASVAVDSTFSVGAIVGPSAVLNANTRFGVYADLDEVSEAGFTASMPEYLAAKKYFGVSPTPEKLVIIFQNTAGDDAETVVAALTDAVSKGADFYGVYYCPKSGVTDAQLKADMISINDYLQLVLKHGVQFYGVTGTIAEVTAANGLLASMKETGTRRAFGMVCDTEKDDAAGLMGVAMGYATVNPYQAFALIYKGIASATYRNMTEAEANQIKALNGNVYVKRTSSVTCIENGASAEGMRFDEVLYLDRIAYDLQSGCFNLIANNEAKLLQNDTTSELFISEINRILEDYYNGGVLATAVWTGPSFGNVVTGATLEHGYAAYADSYDLQSEEDRAARKAMPITVLLKLSGAVESVVLNLYAME